MTLSKFILFGLLLLPAAEIAAFLVTAAVFGAWAALAAAVARRTRRGDSRSGVLATARQGEEDRRPLG